MLALFGLVCTHLGAAEPWEITRFEVVAVEPAGVVEDYELFPILEMMVRAMRTAGFDPDFPGIFETVPLEAETKEEIEQILTTSALQMEQWGFPPPALEPVVTLPDGEQAFRVYLVTGRADYAAIYHGDPCWDLLRGETAILLDAGNILDDGRLSHWGTQIVVHELFHAVQFSTNYVQSCQRGWAGQWMIEGQARAIGIHMAERFRASELRTLLSTRSNKELIWGQRNYSRKLPYPYQSDATPAYRSSSFWQFLAQFQASGGQIAAPTPVFPQRDFSYLADMLEAEPELLDCRTEGEPCTRELAWVDAQVRRTVGRPLHDLYARFMAAYALYGRWRLDGQIRVDPEWLDGSFENGCRTIQLEDTVDGFQSTTVLPFFDIAATHCWRVDIEGFDQREVNVLIKASPAGENNPLPLGQLTALVADGGTQLRRGELGGSPTDAARWEFTLPVGKESLVLLTNLAGEAGNSRVLRNLAVEFVVLKEYARMASGSGPSGADIDQALPIELDRFAGYVYPHGYEQRDGRYVGVIDEVAGLVDPCVIRFPLMINSRTQDAVSFGMNRSGPLLPGTYAIADSFEHRVPDEVPGQFVATFRIGRGNPLSGGRNTDYYLRSGTITIDSVSGGLVRGRLSGNGEAERTVYGQARPNFPQLSVATEFSVRVERPGRRDYSDQPYACLASGTPSGTGVEPERPTPTPRPAEPVPPVVEPEPPVEARGERPTRYRRQWVEIDSVIDGVPTEAVFGDEALTLAGGCARPNPLNFGFSTGSPADGSWRYLSFTTHDIVEAGALGSFALSELKFEPDVRRPDRLPADSPVRVPVRFSGTGTLTLDEHDTSPTDRRLSGTVEGQVVDGRSGRQATVRARFSVPFSCR